MATEYTRNLEFQGGSLAGGRRPVVTKTRSIVGIGLAGFIFAALFLYMWAKPLPNARGNKVPEPLWEIDLTKIGYQTGPSTPLQSPEVWPLQQGVFFAGPNVAAIFFVVPGNPHGTSTDQSQPSPSSAYHLVAAFV